jgi:hypothetical protein
MAHLTPENGWWPVSAFLPVSQQHNCRKEQQQVPQQEPFQIPQQLRVLRVPWQGEQRERLIARVLQVLDEAHATPVASVEAEEDGRNVKRKSLSAAHGDPRANNVLVQVPAGTAMAAPGSGASSKGLVEASGVMASKAAAESGGAAAAGGSSATGTSTSGLIDVSTWAIAFVVRVCSYPTLPIAIHAATVLAVLSMRVRGTLQDFDMAGCEGEAFYPNWLNPDIPWHAHVGPGCRVLQEHDRHLLEATMRGKSPVPPGLAASPSL